MATLNKREILLALIALGAVPTLAHAQAAPDFSGGREIGEAWLAANPGADVAALRGQLLPSGYSDAALASLRTRVADDFRNGALFNHRGWRLSQTEAQLFAVLAV